MPIIPCATCGNEVQRSPSQLRRGQVVTCSHACRKIAQQTKNPPEARFWAKVINHIAGCWEWRGATTTFGYGKLVVNGSYIDAHRFSWALHHGPIPPGVQVLHHCDNPSCARPDHLWLGTARDNIRDCQRKERNIYLLQRTQCPHGHAYAAENVYIRTHASGQKQQCCRACMRLATKRWREKKKLAK